MVGSRVVAKWGKSFYGIDYYCKAYVKSINGSNVQNTDHYYQYHKLVSKTSIVLDFPPNPGDLKSGARVLVPSSVRYYRRTIISVYKNSQYYVRDDTHQSKSWFNLDQLRFLNNEKFCNQ